MKAIILVGGEGTRLRPLTLTTPKPLLPLVNRPFIERQIEWLASYGIDEVVLSLGYRADRFVEHFPEASYHGVTLEYAVEPEPLGTAGGIRFAAGNNSERLIVCNGDILTDMDLGALIDFHEQHGANATIALTQVADPSAFGVVPTREDGKVIAFVEKPPAGQAPTDWINAGTYVLEPSVLDMVPEGVNVSIEREVFPKLLEQPAGRLFAVRSDAYWLDMGTPEQYLQAHYDVLADRVASISFDADASKPNSTRTEIHADAILEEAVVLGEGTTVAAGARIRNSVLGLDCDVAAGAIVEDAVLLDGAVVGPGAHIAEAILGSGCMVAEGAHVAGRSIVADGAVVGPHISVVGVRVEATA